LAADGQKKVAEALGVTLERLPVTPAPTMRLIPLPDGALISRNQVRSFYEALSEQRVEVAPVWFDGVAYLRIAAAPYNTADDYQHLANVVWSLLHGRLFRPVSLRLGWRA
jgi:isopenicillin-N epimerase